MNILRWICIVLGALGVLDTLFVMCISNMNLGVVLPGIMGAVLLVIGVLLPYLPHALRWVLLGGYMAVLLCFLVTIGVLLRAAPQSADADVVIVLGAGLRGEEPMRVLKNRLDTAAAFLAAHPGSVAVLSGGQGENEPISEAEAMYRYMLSRGVDEARLLREDRSRDTKENFMFSYALIREKFGENVRLAFVTTNFHVYRAGLVAKAQGIEAAAVGAPDLWYIAPNNYMRGCVAIWGYTLRGDI